MKLMSNLYDYRDYDKNLNLKVSFGLWLVILYLLRPYILMISTIRMGPGAGTVKGVDGLKQIIYPDDFSLTLGILATLPALLFVIAWTRRTPTAGGFVRNVWRNGVLMLSIAVLLNIVIIFVPILTGVISRIHMLGWLQIILSLIVLAYLLFSQRVKDTFADFPAEEKKSTGT